MAEVERLLVVVRSHRDDPEALEVAAGQERVAHLPRRDRGNEHRRVGGLAVSERKGEPKPGMPESNSFCEHVFVGVAATERLDVKLRRLS